MFLQALHSFLDAIHIYDVIFRIYWAPYGVQGRAFEASTNPVDTSAQAALAPVPHPTTEQEESADTLFMEM
jgi:hypothetical protein